MSLVRFDVIVKCRDGCLAKSRGLKPQQATSSEFGRGRGQKPAAGRSGYLVLEFLETQDLRPVSLFLADVCIFVNIYIYIYMYACV